MTRDRVELFDAGALYCEGMEAGCAGQPRTANPYEHASLIWLAGWDRGMARLGDPSLKAATSDIMAPAYLGGPTILMDAAIMEQN